MKDRILWIVPTRERPEKLMRMLESWLNCTTGLSDILVVLDDDDHTYDHLFNLYPTNIIFCKDRPARGSFLKILNKYAVKYSSEYKFIGFCEDDTVFRTRGYENRFIDKLDEIGENGIVYADDLLNNAGLIYFPVMNSSIIRRLGYMVPPSLNCMYADDFWRDLSTELGTTYRFNDIVIEHLIYLLDSGFPRKDNVAEIISKFRNSDRIKYREYLTRDFKKDLEKLNFKVEEKKLQIIVQAGGRGSRLRHHTWNKPKCLVSVRGKPILYHLFDIYPDAEFHIIGDYAFNQLQKYVRVNPPGVSFNLYKVSKQGTCSGIRSILKKIPKDTPVMIIWGDLILKMPLKPLPPTYHLTIYVTTEKFCRWSVDKDGYIKEQTGPYGIPGIFYVRRADRIPLPPEEGDFVRWLKRRVPKFTTAIFNDFDEIGEFSSIKTELNNEEYSRYFNNVIINETTVEKKIKDKKYEHMLKKEQDWYRDIKKLGYNNIPEIISTDPYILQKINGKHAFQITNYTEQDKYNLLLNYITTLSSLHKLNVKEYITDDAKNVYINKTIERVESIRLIIPNFDKHSITINGKKCRNVFSDLGRLNSIFELIKSNCFTPIHGDPTFSNSIIDENGKIWFIDPRGYFSTPGIWGDPLYDFAKLYYSAVGGYDNFNRRKFKLYIDSYTAEIMIEESQFLSSGSAVFSDYFGERIKIIKILHGLIWLSFSGFVKDDIDSIISSYYLGLYYLEQGLE